MAEIIHTQEYDRWSFDPPMPVLDTGLSRPGTQTFSASVVAVIDTGADGSLIPIDLLERIDAPASSLVLLHHSILGRYNIRTEVYLRRVTSSTVKPRAPTTGTTKLKPISCARTVSRPL